MIDTMEGNENKNAFQYDSYRPLVNRMLQSASRGGAGSGGVVPGPGGCLLLGGLWSRGVPGPGGVCSWGVVPGPGGVCSRGGVGIPACTEADTPPPVDRHTPVKILPWPNFVAASKYDNLAKQHKKKCFRIKKASPMIFIYLCIRHYSTYHICRQWSLVLNIYMV